MPRVGDGPAALQLDVQSGEGLHADHVVHDPGGVGVMRAVVELLHGSRGVFKTVIPGGFTSDMET